MRQQSCSICGNRYVWNDQERIWESASTRGSVQIGAVHKAVHRVRTYRRTQRCLWNPLRMEHIATTVKGLKFQVERYMECMGISYSVDMYLCFGNCARFLLFPYFFFVEKWDRDLNISSLTKFLDVFLMGTTAIPNNCIFKSYCTFFSLNAKSRLKHGLKRKCAINTI